MEKRDSIRARGPWHHVGRIMLLLCGVNAGCALSGRATPPRAQIDKAQAMLAERCKTAGVTIHRTVSDVDGIVLLKLRPQPVDVDNQFTLDDPYGRDLFGDGYIESFLRGGSQITLDGRTHQDGPPRIGYLFVDAIDQYGLRSRYTGQPEEPWLTDKSYLKGYIRFVLHHEITEAPAPRYGVTYDDISTKEERDHWIAGSSLRVVDLATNEIIAERIGYMMDPWQGNRAHGRSPWLYAADDACPAFVDRGAGRRVPAFASQAWQTQAFVEKVLFPRQ